MTGNRISQLVSQGDESVRDFARRCDVPEQTMYKIMKKPTMKSITVDVFLKIAHGLGMTAEELYYGESYERAARPALSVHDRRMLDAYHMGNRYVCRMIDHAVDDAFEDMDEAAKNEERSA